MNNKNLNEFDKKGFVIVKNLFSKSEIKLIYSQLEQMIDAIIDYNRLPINKKITLDHKYLLLKKISPKLKSHFYDMLPYIDCVNNLTSSKKILNIIKSLLNSYSYLIEKNINYMDLKP